jgi:4-hydroxy-tetrahydrodipicolinate synthase
MDLAGVYAAALTPVRDDLQIIDQALVSHCHDLIQRGCRGVVLFGTTGEGPSFTLQQRKTALERLIWSGIEPQQIFVGTSFSAIDDVVELTRMATRLNCLGTLLMPPFFYKKIDERGVVAFYREVIRRAADPQLKIILYHIPQYSGVPITLEVIKTLRTEFPESIVGLKESEGNLPFSRQILEQFPQFHVFVGNELHISEAVAAGASGAISGMANIFPELIRSLYDDGKDSSAPNHNEQVKRLMEVIKKFSSIPAMKQVLAFQKGEAWQTLVPPLYPLDHEQQQQLILGIEG